MDRTPSKTRAALWMSGWLALMLIVAVAGREATREVNVFQVMAVRGVLGFVVLVSADRTRELNARRAAAPITAKSPGIVPGCLLGCATSRRPCAAPR
ncbi:hypothetical protein ACVIW0_004012 [Bradyrhizobium sp. USDA 4454]